MLKVTDPNKIITSTIIVISVFMVICLLNVCKKKEAANPKMLVWDIFGRPDKIEDSGAVLVEYDPAECVIHYNFQSAGKSKYEEELGTELTPKLKKLFEKDKNIEDAFLTIFGPSTDTYGRYGWKPALSFEFDRDTFNGIDWGSFSKKDLLNVAINLKWYRKSDN
jgi:hypothetical protein